MSASITLAVHSIEQEQALSAVDDAEVVEAYQEAVVHDEILHLCVEQASGAVHRCEHGNMAQRKDHFE